MSKYLILIFLLVLPIPAEARIKYFIEASFYPETNKIHGTLHAYLDGLKEPLLILYPNIYLREGPKESYPRRFNPGSIDIISLKDGEGRPIELRPVNSSQFIVHSVRTSGKLISEIKIEFFTKVPERLGPFGHYDSTTTLQGGWHPLFSGSLDREPPSSDYKVRITIPLDYSILHTGVKAKDGESMDRRVIEFEARDIKSPTVVISKRFIKNEDTIGGKTFEYYFFEKDKWYIDRASEIINLAEDFFRRNFPEPELKTIRVGEVYLYSDMAIAGEDVILVNNRFFKVFPYLRRFHERELVNALYTIYWRRIIKDEDWVVEGMAGYSTELYINERYHERPDLAKKIKPFSFIPAIDYIIYSPQLPFRKTYFITEGFEGFREDIRLFNSRRLEGGRIFSKLRNLIGDEMFRDVIREYISSSEPFRKVSEALFQKDLRWFYNQWLNEIPETDYYLKGIKRRKEDDTYITEITIGKRGKGKEPVELYMRDAGDKEDRFIWNGEGEEFNIKRYTLSPIRVIEIDPEKKVLDIDRSNNRTPRGWKYLLHRFRLSYDFQISAVEGDILVSLQRPYESRRFLFNYYHRFELDGLRVGYDYYKRIGYDFSSYRWREKGIYFSLGIERLSGKFERPGDRYVISPILIYRDGGIEIGLEPSSKIIGSDYSYLKLWLTAIKEFQIANNESVAFRAVLGQSTGEMPEHKLFFLGGITGARGFSKAEDRGENISLFTGEYRFPLIYDLDKNLLGLVTAHTLQVALFADTGMVSDKRDTFRFREYRYDIGIGFRFYADLFGIFPGIGRVDMAIPIGPDVRHRPAFYISIGQSF